MTNYTMVYECGKRTGISLFWGCFFKKQFNFPLTLGYETDYSRLADIQLVGCLLSSVHACGIIVKYSTQNVEEV